MKKGLCKAKIICGLVAISCFLLVFVQGKEVRTAVFNNLRFIGELSNWFIVFNVGVLSLLASLLCSIINAARVLGGILIKHKKVAKESVLTLIVGGADVLICMPTVLYFFLFVSKLQTNMPTDVLVESLDVSVSVLRSMLYMGLVIMLVTIGLSILILRFTNEEELTNH